MKFWVSAGSDPSPIHTSSTALVRAHSQECRSLFALRSQAGVRGPVQEVLGFA